MSTALHDTPAEAGLLGLARTESSSWRDSRYQAYMLLRIGFTVAPVAFGLDKFWNQMVFWPKYLAPWVNNLMPGNAQDFMHFVGVVEIVAGIAVLLKPRYGGYLVAGWLAGIVTNLFSYPGWYDVAVRDFGRG